MAKEFDPIKNASLPPELFNKYALPAAEDRAKKAKAKPVDHSEEMTEKDKVIDQTIEKMEEDSVLPVVKSAAHRTKPVPTGPEPEFNDIKANPIPRAVLAPDERMPIVSKTADYLSKRKRVQFELSEGTYTMPIIDVVPCKYGIMVLMPCTGSDVTFTPKPGADISVTVGDKTWACYCPGTSFMINELGVLAVVCVLKDA